MVIDAIGAYGLGPPPPQLVADEAQPSALATAEVAAGEGVHVGAARDVVQLDERHRHRAMPVELPRSWTAVCREAQAALVLTRQPVEDDLDVPRHRIFHAHRRDALRASLHGPHPWCPRSETAHDAPPEEGRR